MSPAPPLTDSGWFWGAVFSVMALAGIGLIARKFDVRQQQVEGRFLGRQRAHEERQRRSAGEEPIDLADSARQREDVAPGRIVPLWTLATAAAVAAAGSLAMLARERGFSPSPAVRASRNQHAAPTSAAPPSEKPDSERPAAG